eukprot:scaffold15652_cov83-Skeletonema_marinoi.AAC.2
MLIHVYALPLPSSDVSTATTRLSISTSASSGDIAPTLTVGSVTLSTSASGRVIAHTVVSDSGDVSVSIATELSTAARHCSHAHGRLRHTLSTSASLAETLLSQ